MPTIYVKKDLIMKQLNKAYTDEEFDQLCFEFGIELDEVTSERKMAMKERGSARDESNDVIYKIDLPANRYDLLSFEGLVQALKIFNKQLEPPRYMLRPSGIKFVVDEHAHAVRPVLLGAVVRNLNLNDDVYNSFIELQDKIHQNIGRKRSIVSIGTHDLDTIKAPFLYTAKNPKKLKFVPLNQKTEFTACELMELYAESHLKAYLPLIKDENEYPVIMDKNQTVLSMPPIINGDKSKISLKTKNILIEVTAKDREKATIALDTIVTMLLASAASNGKYEAESVQIEHFDGRKYETPNLNYHDEKVNIDYINKGLGVDLTTVEIVESLIRMGLNSRQLCEKQIAVGIPPTRHDIIHKCDIMEDVGIAFGYDNILKTLPKSATISTQVPLNKLSDQLRNEVSRCGFTEALNFALCPEAELSTMLRKEKAEQVVRIENPKTADFQVARTSLLPGLFRTIGSNKNMPLPLKLFEVGDVVIRDLSKDSDVGARNERRLAAIYHGKKSPKFELIHGLLDRIMQVLDVPYIGESQTKGSREAKGYYVEACDDSVYLAGRSARVMYNGCKIGSLGVVHPEVLSMFDLTLPTAAIEISIEAFPFVANNCHLRMSS